MAVVLGVSSGFVESAPEEDPSGSVQTADNVVCAQRDTTPGTPVTITEIGWWCDNATQEANFEVGIYEDITGGDTAQGATLIGIDTSNAKGTSAGWKRCTGLNISLDADTIYWIAVQLDNTATTTQSDYSSDASEKQIWDSGNSELPDPIWDIFGSTYAEVVAYYALIGEAPAAPTTSINIADVWKSIAALKINIGDAWKAVAAMKINIGDAWKVLDIA